MSTADCTVHLSAYDSGPIYYAYRPANKVVPVVQVQAVHRVCAGVHVLLVAWAHRVLVHRGVWLGRSVVPWGQAVASLTTIVTVTVIHSTVQII